VGDFMSRQYKILDGSKLLTYNTYAWWSLNNNKKEEDFHHLLIELEKIDEVESDIVLLRKQCLHWARMYKGLYESIFIEQLPDPSGDGSPKILVGKRLENTLERDYRLSLIQRIKDQKESESIQKEKDKEERDLQTFLVLKEKFEGRK
jgi:hypothetical protein